MACKSAKDPGYAWQMRHVTVNGERCVDQCNNCGGCATIRAISVSLPQNVSTSTPSHVSNDCCWAIGLCPWVNNNRHRVRLDQTCGLSRISGMSTCSNCTTRTVSHFSIKKVPRPVNVLDVIPTSKCLDLTRSLQQPCIQMGQ
jgi:hypothetical protein